MNSKKPYEQPGCSQNRRVGWVLCSSKTFPGRYYYFNGQTGESVWCLNENDRPKQNKRDDKFVSLEPSSPPPPEAEEAESPNTLPSTSNTNPMFAPRGNIGLENRYREASSSFGMVTFPQYFPFVEYYSIPAIPYSSQIWSIPNQQYFATAMPAPVFSMGVPQNKETSIRKSLHKVTQTSHEGIHSKAELDKRPPQSIPVPSRNEPLTKSESAQANIGVESCKCIEEHKKFTMPEKHGIVNKSDASTNQEFKSNGEDMTLLKPAKSIITFHVTAEKLDNIQKENGIGKNCDLNEKFTKTVQIVNQSPEEDLLDGRNLESIGKNDLRHILIARRKKSVDGKKVAALPNREAKIKKITHPLPSPASKKVTFNINNPQSLDGNSSASVQRSGRSFEPQQCPNQEVLNPQQDLCNTNKLQNLSKLLKDDIWYIVVDLQALVQELTLLEGLVSSDKQCRIQIPAVVQSQLYSLCKGDCRARPQAMAARRVARHVASNVGTFIVEEKSGLHPFVDNGVIQCCNKIVGSGHHAILVSDNAQLRLKAKDIHSLTVQELKSLAKLKQKTTFDMTSFKTSLQNESTQKLAPETPFKPYPANEVVIFTAEDDLENGPATLTEKRQAQNETTQDMIDAQTSPIKFNSPHKLAKTTGKTIQNVMAFVKNDTKTTKDVIEEELEKFAAKHKKAFAKNDTKTTKDVIEEELEKFALKHKKAVAKNNTKTTKDVTEEKLEKFLAKDFAENDTKTAKDVIEELEKFAAKNKEMEQNLILRRDEGIVFFMQIMEEVLNDILQSKPSPDIEPLPPPVLKGIIERFKVCYQHDENMKALCEKFLDAMKSDIESWDIIRLIGCGYLLLEGLQNPFTSGASPQTELAVKDAMTSLDILLKQLNSPVVDDVDVGGNNESQTRESRKNALQIQESRKNALQTQESRKNALQTQEGRKNALQKQESRKNALQTQESRKNALQTQESRKNALQTQESRKNALQKQESRKNALQTQESRKNESQTQESTRIPFVKKPSEVVDYLQRHYPASSQPHVDTTEYSRIEAKIQDNEQVDATNPQEIKIIRTVGGNLKNFRIHSTKTLTFENKPILQMNSKAPVHGTETPFYEYDTGNTFDIDNNDEKTDQNVVRKANVIKEFEEKLKLNSDMDLHDIPEVSLFDTKLNLNFDIDLQESSVVSLNDITDKFLLKDLELSEITTDDDEKNKQLINTIKDNEQLIDNITTDDGLVRNKQLIKNIKDNDIVNSDNDKAHEKEVIKRNSIVENSNESVGESVVNLFLDRTSDVFMGTYKFLLATKSEVDRKYHGLKKNRKYALYSKVKRAQADVAEMMDTLRNVRDRNISENHEVSNINLKIHSYDIQLSIYGQLVTEFLKQFELLRRALRVLQKCLYLCTHRHRANFGVKKIS